MEEKEEPAGRGPSALDAEKALGPSYRESHACKLRPPIFARKSVRVKCQKGNTMATWRNNLQGHDTQSRPSSRALGTTDKHTENSPVGLQVTCHRLCSYPRTQKSPRQKQVRNILVRK